jgi:hypothetical protein
MQIILSFLLLLAVSLNAQKASADSGKVKADSAVKSLPASATAPAKIDTAAKSLPAVSTAPIKPDTAAAPAKADSGKAQAKAPADSTAQLAPAGKVDTVQSKPAEKERKTVVRDKKGPKDEAVEVIETYKGDVNKLKSPKKAFFLSFIFPGLGQFYAKGGIIRVGVPVAVELASYTAALIFKSKYNSLTKDYQKQADTYYDHNKFITWYNKVITDSGNIVVPDSMSHVLTYLGDYQSKNDEYYELIAKYDEFTQGWVDAIPNMIENNFAYMNRDVPGTTDDPHYRAYAIDSIGVVNGVVKDTIRQGYHDNDPRRPFLHGRSQRQLDNMDMRTQANNMGDRILWAFYAMMINRMVSSIDAVFAATSYNRKITGGNLTLLDKMKVEPALIGRSDLTTNGVKVCYTF